jgi:hypothetical protein
METSRTLRLTIAAALLVSWLPAAFLFGNSDPQRRVQAGARFFKSLLAADLDLGRKASGSELLIVLYYTDDRRAAEDLASSLRGAGTDVDRIRGFQAKTEITTDPAFRNVGGRVPAGIYLVQPPDGESLTKIIRYGIDNSVIVYSPFEGHVEKGVLGGMAVEAQVRPYINAATMQASHIRLKPFFMKVTKVFQ